MTLTQFVDTRANDHANYPYLTWTSDQCTGSPDEAHYTISGFAVPGPSSSARSVLIYRACWRHDFNWRNLSRIEHFVDPNVDSWNQDAKDDSDALLEQDFRRLCDSIFPEPAWIAARNSCYIDAAAYELVVSNITHLWDVIPSPDIGPPERTE
ncbi:phospholipase A2 [Candidatus Poriferisodalis sp.]|uniref:phospholipase A2 n=1 Tax=Candidatus Poriferisodalis sp. TaxID=3101277 RepID=UPI003B02635D